MGKHYYILESEIDHMLSDYSDLNVEIALRIIAHDKALQEYFFKFNKSIDWFYKIKDAGYFDSLNNPFEIETPPGSGYYKMPKWPALRYLENISSNENLPDDIIIEILEIIKDISSPKIDRSPDNPRTWGSIVKILTNLPKDKIPIEIFDFVPRWIKSRFRMSIPDHEILSELLPKFLKEGHNNEDIKKTEKIIENILPYDDDGDTPRLIIDNYWLNESLIRSEYGQIIGKECSVDLIYNICNKLKEIQDSQYCDKSGSCSKDIDEYSYIIEIKYDDQYCLDVTFKKIYRQDNSVTFNKEFNHIADINNPDKFDDFIKSKLNDYADMRPMLDKVDARELYFDLFQDNSYIWYSSFDRDDIELNYDAKELIVSIIYTFLNAKTDNGDIVEPILQSLMEFETYPYAIFKRIAIRLISDNWDKYKNILWSELNKPYGRYFLIDPNIRIELDSLFRNNVKNLTQSDKNIIQDYIEQGPVYKYSDEQIRIDRWKQEWYSSLKSDPEFKVKYDKLRAKTNVDLQIKEDSSYFRVGRLSPKTAEQLAELPIDEIIKYFNEFRSSGFNEPDINGLAEEIENVIQRNPEKYINDLEKFIDAKYLLVYEIISAIRKVWAEKKPIDWENILSFLLKYFQSDKFKSDELLTEDDDWQINHNGIIGEISWLIRDAIKDDDWSMPSSCIGLSIELLKLCLNKAEERSLDDEFREQLFRDPVTYALNSSRGKVLTSVIFLSLWIARTDPSRKDKKDRWLETELKTLFENALNGNIREAYILFGQYIPNFSYLNIEWVTQNIERMRQLQDNDLWYFFMCGYLFNKKVYYAHMKNMVDFYKRALEEFGQYDSKNGKDSLIEHIAIGYLGDISDFSLADGLLKTIFERWSPDEICKLLEVFYRKPRLGKDESLEALEEKMLQVWGTIISHCQIKLEDENLNDDDKKVLSHLLLLTLWIPKLDEKHTKWLEFAVPHAQKIFNIPLFIEQLSYFIDGPRELEDKGLNALYISRIYLKLMEGEDIPDYKEDKIKSLITYIYENGNKKAKNHADLIIDKYARSGNDMLKKIWEDYNIET